MSPNKKLRIMVLYGGRSGEHEISLRSAASVIQQLDTDKFEIVPVAIDKSGKWLPNDIRLIENSGSALPAPQALPVYKGVEKVDVVFPVMHGPLCEDGTIQGLLELADVPYVGCGVLASAVGMDKDFSKRLARDAGIPIVPYLTFKKETWHNQKRELATRIEKELGYPVFIKPANLGSSVGIHKVKTPENLASAMEDAFNYDTKVLVERGLNVREIELAVLENENASLPPIVSKPGEIVPTHEFYSYDAKYIDENGAGLRIPAELDPSQTRLAQDLALNIFQALGCEGLARVDLFLDKSNGQFYFNEVNTLPGFTSISMYPKLWEHSGISYKELLSRLIELAISRHQRKKNLMREFHK